jgi:hypothetical protein
MANIIQGTNFDVNKDITFSAPKVTANGRRSIGVSNKHCKTSKITYINTPLMLTWGVSVFVDDKTGKESFDMALQFPQPEHMTADDTAFLKNMQAFEQKIKELALENSKEWLGKPIKSADVIDALWTPMLKYPKDKATGEYDYSRSPTLKVKLHRWDDVFTNIELYDVEQVKLFPNNDGTQPIDLVTKGSHVATVIACGGIWVADSKCGVTWKLLQAIVKPPSTMMGRCHISLSSKDKDTIIASAAEAEAKAEATHHDAPAPITDTTVEDSDDDDDDDDVVEPPVVEPPVVETPVVETPVVEPPVVEPEPEPEVVKVVVEDAPKKKKVNKKKAVVA